MTDTLIAGQHPRNQCVPTMALAAATLPATFAARRPRGTRVNTTHLSGRLEPDAQLTRSVVVFPRAACVLAEMIEDDVGLRVRELHTHGRPFDLAFDDHWNADSGANRAKHVGHGDLVERDGD